MADTLKAITGESLIAQSQFQALEQENPTGRVIVSVSYKVTAGNPATDLTLFTVPAGKTFVLTKLMSGKSNGTTQDGVLYDSSGDVAADARIFYFTPDWSSAIHTYQYMPGILFQKGVTIDSSYQTVGHHYFFDLQGYLV